MSSPISENWNIIHANNRVYVRVSDVVAALVDFAEAEEYDTKRRILEWAKNIEVSTEQAAKNSL